MLKSEYLRFQYFEKSDCFLRPKSFYIGSYRAPLNISSPSAAPEMVIKNAEGKKFV